MVPAPSGNRGAPTKKRKLQTNDNVKSAEFDSPFLADSLNFKPAFLTNMIDLDLGTSAVSFRICYWNNMESQFLSPVGVPPHLRSEGIYRVHTSVYVRCSINKYTFTYWPALLSKKIHVFMFWRAINRNFGSNLKSSHLFHANPKPCWQCTVYIGRWKLPWLHYGAEHTSYFWAAFCVCNWF